MYKGTGKKAKLDPQQPVSQNYKLAKLGTKGKSGSWTVVSWKGRKRYIPTVQVSTKKTPVIMRTNRDKVEFFSHRGKTRKSLGFAHNKGYRIALIETAGSWSREIGRASCRERVEIWVVAEGVKKRGERGVAGAERAT